MGIWRPSFSLRWTTSKSKVDRNPLPKALADRPPHSQLRDEVQGGQPDIPHSTRARFRPLIPHATYVETADLANRFIVHRFATQAL
jgi:hypothetical protein